MPLRFIDIIFAIFITAITINIIFIVTSFITLMPATHTPPLNTPLQPCRHYAFRCHALLISSPVVTPDSQMPLIASH